MLEYLNTVNFGDTAALKVALLRTFRRQTFSDSSTRLR